MVEGVRQFGDRLGADAIETGVAGRSFRNDGAKAVLATTDGERRGAVLIAADGLHSAIRRQMFPREGAPIWAGAILWRGATRARNFSAKNQMAMIGDYDQKFVTYPISAPDENEFGFAWQ